MQKIRIKLFRFIFELCFFLPKTKKKKKKTILPKKIHKKAIATVNDVPPPNADITCTYRYNTENSSAYFPKAPPLPCAHPT